MLLSGPHARVSVYAVNPGPLALTDFWRNYPWYQRCVLIPYVWLVGKDSWHAAQTAVYCAVDASVEKDNGKYYRLITGFTFVL